ncbi:MAG: glycine cleavage system aminomethyltransferase GcvT [Planctomycetota bacterium]|nr:glycine cleavage system aminomethyltransferase GcvT [Planctomycetota bacterium]
MSSTPLRTPLASWHESHGGRLVDFAGWSMPVQYSSIVDEHLATRRAAGMFDVSHMGRLAIEGPAARDWLESLLTRRVADIAVGQARYTLVTTDTGPDGLTILDDALVTRETDAPDGTPRLAMVVNASNRDRVVAWLRSRLPASGVSLVDRTAETAMIAVQGPLAVATVCVLCGDDDAGRISGLGTYRAARAFIVGQPAAVSRTGYTGEDGLEVVVPATVAEDVWQAILAAGGPRGLKPCGLGARDTLRLEAGMPLYGHELVASSDPFAIGLGLAVNLDGAAGGPRQFPGREALVRLRAAAPQRVRVGLACDSKRAAREGSAVVAEGGPVGTVTSGSLAPSLDRAVAMALVDRPFAAVGTRLTVMVRDVPQPATVVPLPFYRRPGPRH